MVGRRSGKPQVSRALPRRARPETLNNRWCLSVDCRDRSPRPAPQYAPLTTISGRRSMTHRPLPAPCPPAALRPAGDRSSIPALIKMPWSPTTTSATASWPARPTATHCHRVERRGPVRVVRVVERSSGSVRVSGADSARWVVAFRARSTTAATSPSISAWRGLRPPSSAEQSVRREAVIERWLSVVAETRKDMLDVANAVPVGEVETGGRGPVEPPAMQRACPNDGGIRCAVRLAHGPCPLGQSRALSLRDGPETRRRAARGRPVEVHAGGWFGGRCVGAGVSHGWCSRAGDRGRFMGPRWGQRAGPGAPTRPIGGGRTTVTSADTVVT